MKVREAADLMGANATSVSAEMFDKEIKDFSIDSRTVGAGELFFALSQKDYARAGFNGDFVDAHRFIRDAFEHGALAAVARADRVSGDPDLEELKDRLLLVEDAIAALQLLAHRVYTAWGKPVVAIRQCGEDDGERVDRARAEECRSSCVEERAQLQQRFGTAVVGAAHGQ